CLLFLIFLSFPLRPRCTLFPYTTLFRSLRLILILNSFLGSSDSLVFSELFHSLAPRPLAARSISDFLLTYRMEQLTKNQAVATRSEERFSRNAETDLVCRLLLEKKKKKR